MLRPEAEAQARPKCPRCGYEMIARYARTGARGGRDLDSAYLLLRFFVPTALHTILIALRGDHLAPRCAFSMAVFR
jgi:hypothetical protein